MILHILELVNFKFSRSYRSLCRSVTDIWLDTSNSNTSYLETISSSVKSVVKNFHMLTVRFLANYVITIIMMSRICRLCCSYYAMMLSPVFTNVVVKTARTLSVTVLSWRTCYHSCIHIVLNVVWQYLYSVLSSRIFYFRSDHVNELLSNLSCLFVLFIWQYFWWLQETYYFCAVIVSFTYLI